MTPVVMRAPLDLSRSHGKQRLRTVERLDLGFLVYAQHHGMLGRVHVQTRDIPNFLDEQGIKPEALVAASAQLERHNQKERDLRVKRATARREKKGYEELGIEKPQSLGRGVSIGMTERAMAGQPVRRLVRRKIVRAVNAQLVSAKKEPVDTRTLFGDVPVKKPKKPKKS